MHILFRDSKLSPIKNRVRGFAAGSADGFTVALARDDDKETKYLLSDPEFLKGVEEGRNAPASECEEWN